jgi:hypothetical protein
MVFSQEKISDIAFGKLARNYLPLQDAVDSSEFFRTISSRKKGGLEDPMFEIPTKFISHQALLRYEPISTLGSG